MNKHKRWLLDEIKQWTDEAIIAPEQAAKLRERYAETVSTVPWGLLVFACAGAIVIGLGIILLLAYNWEDIPKAGKLALIFIGLIAAHLSGIRLLRREGWQPHLGEALTALGTMIYGAGIWLVAQVYNIDEHYPNGFLYWALGALAMAWAIRSTANGILAAILVLVWGSCEAFGFRDPEYAAILLVALGLLPLAWQQRSALLLAVGLAVIQFLVAVNVGLWGQSAHAFNASLALGVLLVGVARFMPARTANEADKSVLLFFGYGAFIVCAYLLTFRGLAHDLLDWQRPGGSRHIAAGLFAWSLFAAGIACWAALGWRALRRRAAEFRREEWLLPIALIYGFGLAAIGANEWAEFVAWSFDLVLLGLAIMWIWRGCQESRLRPTVLGSLLLSAVVFARYFDLFHDLASRGLAFIVLGVIFVIEAMYYRKVRRETSQAS